MGSWDVSSVHTSGSYDIFNPLRQKSDLFFPLKDKANNGEDWKKEDKK